MISIFAMCTNPGHELDEISTYELGSYSLLNWNGKRCDGIEHPILIMVDKYHGCVVKLYERNMHDDSDFMAIVWEESEKLFKNICYASTRGWTYSCGATVDATPEVLELFDRWNLRAYELNRAYEKAKIKFIPKIGKVVRSTTVRGKSKNKSGVLTWMGASKFSRGKTLRFQDSGVGYYVETANAELWDEETEQWYPCAQFSQQSGWVIDPKALPSVEFSW